MAYITNEIKTVSGTNISINDSDQKLIKDIQLQGDTTQNTTLGTNLLANTIDILKTNNTSGTWSNNVYTLNGVSFTYNDDGSITATGQASANTQFYINRNSPYETTTLQAGTYYFTTHEGTGSNSTWKMQYNAGSGAQNVFGTGSAKEQTTTVNDGQTVSLYLYVYSGKNPNGATFYPMIATTSGVDYEQYTFGASPNPNFPQEVQTVTGRQEIDVVGKNIFDETLMTSTSSSIKYIPINVEKNTNYTLSTNSGTSTLADVFLSTTNSGATTANNGAMINSPRTINSENNNILYVGYRNDLSSYWVQLEKGNTPSQYEKYKKTSYEINLGKNIYDYTTSTFDAPSRTNVVMESNTLTITTTGDYTGNQLFFKTKIPDEILENGATYTISSVNVSGVVVPLGLQLRNKDGSYANKAPVTSVVYDDTYSLYVSGNIFGSGSSTTIPSGTTAIIKNIQVEKGSTATTYSSYFEPIELSKISTYQDKIFKSTGKNLFDKDNANILTANLNETDIGSSDNAKTLYIQCKPNTTYTISKIQSSRFRVATTSVQPALNVSVSQFSGYDIDSNTTYTFTTNSTAKYICVYFYLNGTDTLTEQQVLNSIMIEESSTASEYEPYEKGWYKYNAIGKVILDGSEDWRTPSSTTDVINFCNLANTSIFDYRSDTDIQYCNALKWNGRVSGHQEATNSGVGLYTYINTNGNYKYDYFIVPKTIASTVTEWKTWLSNNNVFVYYVLATPTYEKITNQELINQLDAIEIKEGINNISVSSSDLSSLLKFSYYSTDNDYYDAIYSQDDKNDLKIWFNDVELQDAAIKCEKITRTARILPDNGNKAFSLDNFISTSLDVILHNVDVEDIVDQVKISIGTLVDAQNNTYQYIPLGVFNIQDTPENANGKITLKLRDNRVKFDFGYNAQPLIENNNGAATKKQILNDICSQAGVENTIDKFNGDSDLIGIYDNTITGSTYISYLMEQDGSIPIIDREGKLIKIELNKLYVWKIPLSILEGYELGEPYKIDRVVYESGIIKYETSSDETLDTLYLDAANPYFSSQSQVDYILNKLQNFEIDSVTTKRVLGNPAIDPYDLIQVYNDLDGTNNVIFTTLANTTYTYNGVHRDIFDTQIGIEQRKENVSLKGDATFQKYAKTSIDNINGEITLVAGTTNSNADNINNLTQMVNSQGESIDALGTRVNQNVESITASVTALQNEISEGVGLVKTTSVTINDDGLSVSTDTSKISTTMDNDSFEIKDSGDTTLAFFGYDEDEQISKAEMDNLTVDNYFVTGVHRIEKNEEGTRTLFFYIGG